MKRICSIIVLLLSFVSLYSQTTKLTVNVIGVKNNKGNIVVGVCENEKQLLGKQMPKYYKAMPSKKGNVKISLEVPNGTYAIVACHDENKNNKFDTNFLGIPKEDYGFSSNDGFIPKFDKAKIVLSGTAKTVNIQLKTFKN